MSGILKSHNSYQNQLVGINLQTSSYGGALPLVYGTTRVAGNMVDYDDFITNKNTQSTGKGGSKTTSYTYTSGAILAICEGPLTTSTAVPNGINRVWQSGSENTAAYYNLTVLGGARPQSPWSIWTSKHPAKAVGYAGMALACNDTFDLGDSGTMANWAFEVQALLATEPDTGSLITLGLGNSSQTTFYLLDNNGNQINNGTTPPWGGYVNPTYYLNGVRQSSGFSVGMVSNFMAITFSSAPASGVVIAWSSTQGVALDAKPSAVLIDFLTSATHGVAGWTAGRISPMITGLPFTGSLSAQTTWMNANPTSWQTYCSAMGFAVSPAFDEQKTAADHLKDLLMATNAEAVWSAGQFGCTLNIIPYGDTAFSGNGINYVPLTAPIYALAFDDFLGAVDANGKPTGDDPVQVTRTAIADVYNTIPVGWWDRLSAYNVSTVQDPEPVDVAIHGTKVGSNVDLHMITRRAHALAISRILAQRSVYLRNSYKFKLGWKYILLEPMDLISITDPLLGISGLIVRIISIDFPEKASEADGFEVNAEAWPFGVGTSTIYGTQTGAAPVNNQTQDPGLANAPIIFDIPPQFSEGGGPEVGIATAGGPQWGGCQVWASTDGSTYSQIGTIEGPCRYGTLSGSLGTTGNATIDLTPSQGALQSASTTNAQNLQTLCWVAPTGTTGSAGEIIGYSTATLTGGFAYTLVLPVRGAFGTTAATHPSGSSFVRLDGNVLHYAVPFALLGQPLYIKLLSYNLWGSGLESLAEAVAYSYTPTSQGTYAINANATNSQQLIQFGEAFMVFQQSCATPGGSNAWSYTCPVIGVPGTQYQVLVTISAPGAGGSNSSYGGGGGGMAQIVLTVQDGTVLSGVVGGPGAGTTTVFNGPGISTTLILGGNNVSGYTSGTLLTCTSGAADVYGGGVMAGTIPFTSLPGGSPVGSASTPVLGALTFPFLCSGSGSGANCGIWTAGLISGSKTGGAASPFGPGGAANGSGAGAAPPSYAFGAGGGCGSSSIGGNGGAGLIRITIL